jgi:hypothetical protein
MKFGKVDTGGRNGRKGQDRHHDSDGTEDTPGLFY